MGRRVVVVLLVSGVAAQLGFAPAPFPKPERRADELSGTWVFIRWEKYGNRSRGSEESYRVEIRPGKFAIVATEGGYREEYAMRAESWSFEATRTSSILLGCYRRQGDELEIIFNCGGGVAPPRAQDFSGRPEFRFVLRRAARP